MHQPPVTGTRGEWLSQSPQEPTAQRRGGHGSSTRNRAGNNSAELCTPNAAESKDNPLPVTLTLPASLLPALKEEKQTPQPTAAQLVI